MRKKLEEASSVVNDYSMNYSYRLQRTSMALDVGTLNILGELAKLWSVSKAEVMRRAVRKAKEEAEREAALPSPLKALDWLHDGGGLTVKEAETFRKEVRAEREAKRRWWELP